MIRTLQVCATCASLHLEYEAWVDVNTCKVRDASNEGECWCPVCEAHDVRTVWLEDVGHGWRVMGNGWGAPIMGKDVEVTVRRSNSAGQRCRLLWTNTGELRWSLSLQVAELPLRCILRAIRARAKAAAAE